MDWSPIEQAAITAAAGIISASGVVIATYVAAHVHNAKVAALLTRAIQLGAGVAHDALTTAIAKGGTPDWVAAKQAAIAEGTDAARSLVSSVNADDVRAALASLLAPDPSVPAGPAPSASASAPPGSTAVAVADATTST